MEKKIKEKMLPYTVAKFSYCEEVLIIYGLPFTQDIGKIKEELRDSVRSFESKIMDCSPSNYHPKDVNGEYFAGKLNGAGKIRLVTKKDLGIPTTL